MPSAPERYVDWINHHVGFNPRGQSHSDELTRSIFADLRERCIVVAEHFAAHQIELRLNVGIEGKRNTFRAARAEAEDDSEVDPNIDGVVLSSGLWVPSTTTPITIENKTIMTAHGKARTNRHNDARAYANHVHNSSPNTVAAFTIVINTALAYQNPDAFSRSAKTSGTNPRAAAEATIDLFTNRMRLRNSADDPVHRCEAVLVLAIDYDGISPTARLVTDAPAPPPGSAFSYDGFLERICRLYTERFGQT